MISDRRRPVCCLGREVGHQLSSTDEQHQAGQGEKQAVEQYGDAQPDGVRHDTDEKGRQGVAEKMNGRGVQADSSRTQVRWSTFTMAALSGPMLANNNSMVTNRPGQKTAGARARTAAMVKGSEAMSAQPRS